jgi:hypothetical protein
MRYVPNGWNSCPGQNQGDEDTEQDRVLTCTPAEHPKYEDSLGGQQAGQAHLQLDSDYLGGRPGVLCLNCQIYFLAQASGCFSLGSLLDTGVPELRFGPVL